MSHKRWQKMLIVSGLIAIFTGIILPTMILYPIYGLAGSSLDNMTSSDQRAIDHKLHLIQTFMTIDRVIFVVALLVLLLSVIGFSKTKEKPLA